MRKNKIRLNEGQLHNIIKKSVVRVINEAAFNGPDTPNLAKTFERANTQQKDQFIEKISSIIGNAEAQLQQYVIGNENYTKYFQEYLQDAFYQLIKKIDQMPYEANFNDEEKKWLSAGAMDGFRKSYNSVKIPGYPQKQI